MWLMCLWGAVYSAQAHDWDALIKAGDRGAFAEALENSPDLRIDAAFMQRLCSYPVLMQAALDHLQGQPSAAPMANTTRLVPRADEPLLVDHSTQGQRLYQNLLLAEALDESPLSIRKKIEARTFIAKHFMDPRSDLAGLLRGKQNVPIWVTQMAEAAKAVASSKMPTVTFDVSKNVSFFIPSRDDGVKAYFSLFLVKQAPSDNEPFHLEDELIMGHDEFTLHYDEQSGDFVLGQMGRPKATVVSFKKILNERELSLFPGVWGMRIKHTTGKDSLRSNSQQYFEVAPGKDYTLQMDMATGGNGVTELKVDLIER